MCIVFINSFFNFFHWSENDSNVTERYSSIAYLNVYIVPWLIKNKKTKSLFNTFIYEVVVRVLKCPAHILHLGHICIYFAVGYGNIDNEKSARIKNLRKFPYIVAFFLKRKMIVTFGMKQ